MAAQTAMTIGRMLYKDEYRDLLNTLMPGGEKWHASVGVDCLDNCPAYKKNCQSGPKGICTKKWPETIATPFPLHVLTHVLDHFDHYDRRDSETTFRQLNKTQIKAIAKEIRDISARMLVRLEKEERKALREKADRPGANRFRNLVLEKYGSKCAVTGVNIPEVLEAAHVLGYDGRLSNRVTNGILLRADIHELFDQRLLAIDVNEMRVRLAPALLKSTYATELEDKMKRGGFEIPNTISRQEKTELKAALESHFRSCSFM